MMGTADALPEAPKEKTVFMEDMSEEQLASALELPPGLKNLGNMFLGNFGMSMDNFNMQQNPDGTYNIAYQNK